MCVCERETNVFYFFGFQCEIRRLKHTRPFLFRYPTAINNLPFGYFTPVEASLDVPSTLPIMQAVTDSMVANEWLGNKSSSVILYGLAINLPNKALIGYSMYWQLMTSGKIQSDLTLYALPLCGVFDFRKQEDGALVFLMVIMLATYVCGFLWAVAVL